MQTYIHESMDRWMDVGCRQICIYVCADGWIKEPHWQGATTCGAITEVKQL